MRQVYIHLNINIHLLHPFYLHIYIYVYIFYTYICILGLGVYGWEMKSIKHLIRLKGDWCFDPRDRRRLSVSRSFRQGEKLLRCMYTSATLRRRLLPLLLLLLQWFYQVARILIGF